MSQCFDGNIPATIRHIQMAQHYFQAMCSENSRDEEQYKIAIESCLQDLDLIRRVTLPDPKVIKMISPLHRQRQQKGLRQSPTSSSPAFFDSSPRLMLQQLLDIGSMEAEVKQLIWCPVAVHLRAVSEKKIMVCIDNIKAWKASNAFLFDKFGVDEALSDSVNFGFAALDKLPMPPANHPALPKGYCLVLALYAFYRARLLWALSIINHGDEDFEIDAYHSVYQLLRFVKTAMDNPPSSSEDSPLGCEALKVGLSPMLFLAGQTCPKPAWIRWILVELDRIGHEGVFNNRAFASSLEVLLNLERRVNRDTGQSSVEHFSPPTSRVISILFPDLDGRGYVTYYAKARDDAKADNSELYIPLCIARWSTSVNDGRPVVIAFDDSEVSSYSEWVLDQRLVKDWVQWLTISEFDLDQTLHDHIKGSRLLPNRAGAEI